MTPRSKVVLSEYERLRFASTVPTEADLRLAARLAGDERDEDDDSRARLRVRWLHSGECEVTASAWIGVVRFTNQDVHVVPKYVGDSLRVLRMVEYATGINMLRRLPNAQQLPANGTDLFDLICQLLTDEVTTLIRDGLQRDYRPTDETLPVLRGRLRTREQYLRRFGQLDQLECSFDEYDTDTPENQLLAAALTATRKRVIDPDTRRRATQLAAIIAESCTPPSMTADWYEQRITYDRRNARYRPAHGLASLILRGMSFEDLFETSSGASASAFLIDMNTIFERFITRLIEEAMDGTGCTVESQSPIRAVIHDDETRRSYSTLRPDVVVTSADGRSVPIDVKYKLYERRRISTGDLYQAFTYAYALGGQDGERRAGLIYPAHQPTSRPTLSIRPLDAPVAARIIGAGIDIPRVLDHLAGPDRSAIIAEVRNTVFRLIGSTQSAGFA